MAFVNAQCCRIDCPPKNRNSEDNVVLMCVLDIMLHGDILLKDEARKHIYCIKY